MGKEITNNFDKMPTRLLNSRDVAEILRISTSKVYKLMRCGELAAVHIGKSIRVKPDDLETFIAQNQPHMEVLVVTMIKIIQQNFSFKREITSMRMFTC